MFPLGIIHKVRTYERGGGGGRGMVQLEMYWPVWVRGEVQL